jgi:hypothetical protein
MQGFTDLARAIGRDMADPPYADLIRTPGPIDDALIDALVRDIPTLKREIAVAYVTAIRNSMGAFQAA